MKRRLYFVLPDVASATKTTNDLLLARVEFRFMHFLGRRDMPLGDLHEASYLQKTDVRHALGVGVGIGVIMGMLLGIYLRLTPIAGYTFGVGTLILCTLLGGLFGAWCATLIGVSTPNSELKQFEKDIEAGKILLMVDVPISRVEEIEALIAKLHPEVADRGVEPSTPVFP
jgi:hypothetical protein